ncbi:MAG: hypothetical protein GF421_10970 [Candidatus Aminicenantes bacterium]|nr:hypothetical protein [Candidatus Aminicenantes bacterium]
MLMFTLLATVFLFFAEPAFIKNTKDGTEAIHIKGCTSILVGKEASTDGSVMTTHTADCGICDWTWHHVPAADHGLDEQRKIYHINQIKTWPPEQGGKWTMALQEGYTGLDIPQPKHTYSYFHGVFGYMNEHQLAMGESTIGCRREMRNPTPAAKFDITMLTLLAMERCRTAREAIKLMGSLAAEYGYGFHDSGEMLAVADPEEAWIFEIMPVGPLWTPESGKPGAVWCAQRVPDDHVSVCPNESRIGEVDLNNKDMFLCSSNIISFAQDKGFYDPESGQPFNWKKAYSPTQGSAFSSGGRRGRLWRFFDLAAPSKDFNAKTPNMELPFSVKPDKKISLQDVMRFTRDKYEGTSFDPSKGIKAGPFNNPNYSRSFRFQEQRFDAPRCICVNNVEYTTITVCRNWLPDSIGGMVWLAFGAQDTSCYLPLFAGMRSLPKSFRIGDHWEFNQQSARWAFDYVDFHTQVMYSYAIKDVRKQQQIWEDRTLKKMPAIEKTALNLHRKDPLLAQQFLTDYSISHAQRAIDAWWDLGNHLLVKYNHFRIYDPEHRRSRRIAFTDEWKKALINQQK